MKQIIFQIREKLDAEVPELQYIDRDWNQMSYEQPPVKYPAALIDLQNVEYQQAKTPTQRAVAYIGINVINRQLISASARAPFRDDAMRTLDIIDNIHRALNLFVPVSKNNEPLCTPLIRTALTKQLVNSSVEFYTISYKFSFIS